MPVKTIRELVENVPETLGFFVREHERNPGVVFDEFLDGPVNPRHSVALLMTIAEELVKKHPQDRLKPFYPTP